MRDSGPETGALGAVRLPGQGGGNGPMGSGVGGNWNDAAGWCSIRVRLIGFVGRVLGNGVTVAQQTLNLLV